MGTMREISGRNVKYFMEINFQIKIVSIFDFFQMKSFIPFSGNCFMFSLVSVG